MDSNSIFIRRRVLQFIVLLIFGIIITRLLSLQIINSDYSNLSNRNVMRSEVMFPSRGEVFDRNGDYLVKSRGCYDLMVVYRNLPREGFDTMQLCTTLSLSRERLERVLRNARNQPRAPMLVTNFIYVEDKLRFDELNINGFYTTYRTAREYPMNVGGNLLGYVGEVNNSIIERDKSYIPGEYIGLYGVESAYEQVLRGKKGVHISMVDTHGAIQGSYMEGQYDTLPQHGKYLISTIDAKLQRLAEKLMEGKVGAVVAIEPSSGEILAMVSSPSYDPDLLVGRERGNNYMEMLYNPRRPLFNRAVDARYPPGSTFKLVQGLVAQQEGILEPSRKISCYGGYRYGNRSLGCHEHTPTLDLSGAVRHSCNTYFCHVYRDIIDNKRYGSPKGAFDMWREYILSFGFGRKLGSDFLNESGGYVPESSYYDRIYNKSWNAHTIISLSIGQGELGCTPLQMANLAAIIANRGYYYIPHIVKKIEGEESIRDSFKERQYTKVDSVHFEPIIKGMWSSANESRHPYAYVPDLDICGKTGTAENPHGADHSTYLTFAPRDNPKIALSVYVENGGFGAITAMPIASLLEEYYLTGEIKRDWLVEYVKNRTLKYPNYDKK
ncbi:MAG: penicillin-binding transpeptidase domain-containing protein [Rikenellaceae bacterium]